MVNYKEIEGRLVAVVVWNLSKQNDVNVHLGQIIETESNYVFENKEKGWKVIIDANKFAELKKVPDALKETLMNADYCLNVILSDLTDM